MGRVGAELIRLRNALRTSTISTSSDAAQQVVRTLAVLGDARPPTSVGEAALFSLVQWLRNVEQVTRVESLEAAVEQALLPLFELPRDELQRPTREPTKEEVAALLHPRATSDVVAGYLGRGNLAAAREAALRSTQPSSNEQDDAFLIAERDSRRQHADLLDAVDRAAASLRALYPDGREDDVRKLEIRANALRNPDPSRFDLFLDPLRELAAEAASHLAQKRKELRAEVESLTCAEEDRRRILALVEEDESLAAEFLALAKSGQALPQPPDEHGDDFSEFFPEIVEVAASAIDDPGIDPVTAIRNALNAEGDPRNRILRNGLSGWRQLMRERRAENDRFRAALAEVLRMIGLTPRSNNWLRPLKRTQRAGFATFRVFATPEGRSYVPALGTQAASYDVTLVWDQVSPKRMLDFIDEANTTQANVILYFGVLSVNQRRELRRLTLPTRGKGFSPVVVDDAVIGWLSTRDESGWKYTQRVTLPFTTFNPYAPYAHGEVPDEVFVGRTDQLQQIVNPNGSMFVYGGRQLGKSALLRRIERMFTDPAESLAANKARTGRVGIYIDLKATGIGDALEPEALWTLLADRLRGANVLPKMGQRAGIDAVSSQLRTWLDADSSNRLLLLLDEADNFMTADAKPSKSGSEFPVLLGLKQLMESTRERRFKPVLAGLHQVQRFHETSNTPVAHGGDDILIGPLNPVDARELVMDPTNALGYVFESDELVWRLLLFTNYQASLVQIVCEALVRHLRERALPASGRIVITRSDVERVCNDGGVRDQIAQRFRWTVNLDNRYRVIALVLALRSLEAKPGETFVAEDLHDECEIYWPIGFGRSAITRREFTRYLDEMVGLGVLNRNGTEYGIRSPNIVGMLGTRENLIQELEDASHHLELEYEYNPAMNRRMLGPSAGPSAKRSPLSDQDVTDLLAEMTHTVSLVVGSVGLGISDVATALEADARNKYIDVQRIDADQVDDLIGKNFRHRIHAILDLSAHDVAPSDLLDLYTKLSHRDRLTATVVLGADFLPLPSALEDVITVPLRRWSIAALRAWHDSPFEAPQDRRTLYRVTSGWPRLVESAMRLVGGGKVASDALKEVGAKLADREYAKSFLLESGMPLEMASAWEKWFSHRGPDGLVESTPAKSDDIAEALETAAPLEVLERLQQLDLVDEVEDGWVLDRAVTAAAAALAE